MDVIIKKLNSYTEEELKGYFHERLNETVLEPPLNTSHDEEPEDLLIGFYNNGDENIKSRCKKIVHKLLNDVLVADSWDNNYISRLLYLADIFEIKEARETVYGLASGGRFKRKYGCYGELHEQLLRDLIFMQGTDTERIPFWLWQFKYPLYTGVAFTGLYKISPDEALKILPELIEVAERYPKRYNLKLIMSCFINDCGGEEFLLKIATRLGLYIQSQLKQWEIVLGIIISIVRELYSQIFEEFERELYRVNNLVNNIRQEMKRTAYGITKELLRDTGIERVTIKRPLEDYSSYNIPSEVINHINLRLERDGITISDNQIIYAQGQ